MARVRLQAYTPVMDMRVGFQHTYNGTLTALWQIGFTGASSTAGVLKRLFSGAGAQALRVGVSTPVQFVMYDCSKHAFLQHDLLPHWLRGSALPNQQARGTPMLHVLCATIGQSAATIVNNPVDLACTRLYNQPRVASGAGVFYSGVWNCVSKTYAAEGIQGLYKGFMANILRQLAHGIPQFVLLEQFRVLFSS
eukprot:gnl/MRDRNA2_/MRDRNA2_326069_c0_seq1.p1 gnl/MRDRNA2_/MRDRNA2_326069_c0~~gnl/MRDRNA2_/MRDRNA2_326069_c0_seq1.p1  ORF type:complete len:207 (-),score=14.60 gnl/MRDRNA2_/MRDRNA2_326069_c0_seq1:20-601(-)